MSENNLKKMNFGIF